jgi:hypothetical protein
METALLAATLGIMLFSSAIVAPAIFAKLGADTAGPLLRAFWPRYYAVNAVLALVAAYFATFDYVALLAASVTAMMAVSLLATPALNRARDAGRHRAFSIGHRALVGVNLVALVTLAWAIFMALSHTASGDPSFVHPDAHPAVDQRALNQDAATLHASGVPVPRAL